MDFHVLDTPTVIDASVETSRGVASFPEYSGLLADGLAEKLADSLISAPEWVRGSLRSLAVAGDGAFIRGSFITRSQVDWLIDLLVD